MTAVENKIPDVSSLVTKTNYNTKISDIEKKITDHNHEKYITNPEFNRLTTENIKARLAQENLITKTDLETEFKKISDRVTSNKTKYLLVENEGLQVLVVVIVYTFGNLKVCMMKGLMLILHLITALLQNYIIMALKQE